MMRCPTILRSQGGMSLTRAEPGWALWGDRMRSVERPTFATAVPKVDRWKSKTRLMLRISARSETCAEIPKVGQPARGQSGLIRDFPRFWGAAADPDFRRARRKSAGYGSQKVGGIHLGVLERCVK